MSKKLHPPEHSKPYGLHLMIDGYGADPEKLADVGLLYQTLNHLPEEIGMSKVGFPHIIQFADPPIAGISGFIFIVESHISVHTYSEQKFISIDVYSCKTFEPEKVVVFLNKIYSIEEMEVQVAKRGLYFNKRSH